MTRSENHEKAKTLLAILATTPAFVFDLVEYKLFGEYHTHPILVEQLLSHRGKYDGSKSIYENLSNHYGEKAAKLAEELI